MPKTYNVADALPLPQTTGVRRLFGVVTSASPLSVLIGNDTQATTGIASTVACAVNDRVVILAQDNVLTIVGVIGTSYLDRLTGSYVVGGLYPYISTGADGTYTQGTFIQISAKTGAVHLSNGAINIDVSGIYRIDLYAAFYNGAAGDYMHFIVGSAANQGSAVCHAQCRLQGDWDSASRSIVAPLNAGTVLHPYGMCENGTGRALADGSLGGSSGGSTTCSIVYLGSQ